VHEENRVGPQEEPRKPENESRWAGLKRVLTVLLAAALALLGGCIGGSSFGGNYAPDFSFWGMPGYEGSGLLGGLVAGLTVFVIGGFATELLHRRGASLWVLAGSLAAIVFGPRFLFPVVPPQEVALALVYIGCAGVGALIGWGISLLAGRAK